MPTALTTTDACAERLRDAILRGDLVPGARLPSERDLATALGVHRATLRTALARLTAAGLVTPRHGSGYAVRDYRRAGGPDLLRDLLALEDGSRLRDAAADLLHVRRALARAVLERLAAAPPDRRALEAFDAALEAFAARVDAGAPAALVAQADLDVVRALLAATGSAVLCLCMNPVAGVLEGVPALRDAIYADAAASVLGWRALRAWLERPNADGIEDMLLALAARDARTLTRLCAHASEEASATRSTRAQARSSRSKPKPQSPRKRSTTRRKR